MSKFKSFLLILVFACQSVIAQTFTSEERRKTAEDILNAVINSIPFDSIYNNKQVYFLANELLTENSHLVLKRENCKVQILSKEKIKHQQYVVLADFTLNWDNPVAVRVQLEIMPDNRTLNMRLEKDRDIWVIKNYVIFDD